MKRLYPHSSSSKAQSPGPVAATYNIRSDKYKIYIIPTNPDANLRCSRADPRGDRDIINSNVSKGVSSNQAFKHNPERFCGCDGSLTHVPWKRSIIYVRSEIEVDYQLLPASPVNPQIFTSPD